LTFLLKQLINYVKDFISIKNFTDTIIQHLYFFEVNNVIIGFFKKVYAIALGLHLNHNQALQTAVDGLCDIQVVYKNIRAGRQLFCRGILNIKNLENLI